jgi:hypothetical protein
MLIALGVLGAVVFVPRRIVPAITPGFDPSRWI